MSTPNRNTRVSLRDIANKLGLSHSTVSRALRDRSRVRPALRQKIQRVAQEMGYRPDPMLSALAQYRQGKVNPEIGSVIGWINRWPEPALLRKYREFDAYWEGASKAAEKFGYRLDEFAGNEQLPLPRLEKILQARGVNAILIPPHPVETKWTGFHWEHYTTVRLGRSYANPGLHLVASDQFSNAVLAFGKIKERGYRRIGFLTARGSKTRGLFWPGYLAAQVDAAAEEKLPSLPPMVIEEKDYRTDEKNVAQWLKLHRPDAILTDVAIAREMLGKAGCNIPDDVGLATLSILDGRVDTGIYQNSEEIGRVGVLLTVSLINDGARGISPIFRQILVAGNWVDGTSLPPRKPLQNLEPGTG